MFQRVPVPRACGADGGSSIPAGSGPAAGRGRGWGAATFACARVGWRPGLSRSRVFLGADTGVKRRGKKKKKNVFCFFSVLQITVKSCPPSPCGRPRPGSPAKETAPAPGNNVPLVPEGDAPRASQWVTPRAPRPRARAARPRAGRGAGGAACPRKGRARPPRPHTVPVPRGTGAGAAGRRRGELRPWVLPRSRRGAPSTAGGGRCPCKRGAPRCWGSHRGGGGGLGWGCRPPSQNAGCRGGGCSGCSAPAPHRTPPPQPGEVPWGLGGGPAQGAGCPAVTPRGAAVRGVPYPPPVPPPSLPATAPGSPGDPHPPPGDPAQSHPINRGRGTPLGTTTPGGGGGWGGRQALISAGVN